MSRRTDIIVTACAPLSMLLSLASIAIAFTVGVAWACLSFLAACYLLLFAYFVVAYVGRGNG